MKPLLTVKEAAQLLACSEAAIRKWLYQRRLPAVKVGRLTRLRLADVERVATNGLGQDRPRGRSRLPGSALEPRSQLSPSAIVRSC